MRWYTPAHPVRQSRILRLSPRIACLKNLIHEFPHTAMQHRPVIRVAKLATNKDSCRFFTCFPSVEPRRFGYCGCRCWCFIIHRPHRDIMNTRGQGPHFGQPHYYCICREAGRQAMRKVLALLVSLACCPLRLMFPVR